MAANALAGGQMPSTHWSVIVRAGDEEASVARQALDFLCASYWYPLYAYLRRSGCPVHDAEDLTQGFFAHLFSKDGLADVRPKDGQKFRSWLLSALRHYEQDEWRKTHAEKRGGNQCVISIDAGEAEARYAQEPADPADPARLYDRKWALTLLQRVLARLEEKYTAKGKHALFNALKPFILGRDGPETQAEIARRLGLKSSTVAVAASRLRERYQELLRAEIAQTVATREEIEEELRALHVAISG